MLSMGLIPVGRQIDIQNSLAKQEIVPRNGKDYVKDMCGRNTNSGPLNTLTTEYHEEAPVLPYSEYRAIASIGPVDPADDNASSGFDDDQDLETS